MRLPRRAASLPALTLAMLAAGVGCTVPEPPPVASGPTPEEIAAGLLPAVRFEGEDPSVWTIEERMAHHEVPAVSVAVMEGGRVTWARAWGVADRELGTPATPRTLFQAASISKPVAALVALSLVEDGALTLDGPVNDVLTSWKVPDNPFTADSVVTLRGLLTHSAGLTVWGFPGYRKDEPFAPGQAVATNVQVLDGLGNTDPVRVYKVPGTSWQYSGGGYTVLEQMVEDATGLPFDEAARLRVLEPAGMTSSTYAQPLPDSLRPHAARGHRGNGEEVEGEWHSYPEQAAAGLWTTPTDLLTLSAHLLAVREGSLAEGVVSEETLRAMLTPHHAGDEGFRNWGLGFGLQGTGDAFRFGHGGSNEGFRAQWTVLPQRGQGVVVMTNGDRGGLLATEIIRAVADAHGWPTDDLRPRSVTRHPLDAGALAAFGGRYAPADQPGFVVEVIPGDGVLVVSVPGQGSSTLHPIGVDRFVDPADGTELLFPRDEAGAVTGLEQRGGPTLARIGG